MSTLPNTADRSLISGFLRLDAQPVPGTAAASAPYPLDPARVADFNAIIQSVAPGAPAVDAALIAAMANELLGDAAISCSASVRKRLEHAGALRSMAADEAWRLPEPDATRVGTVMGYLDRRDDLIPDDVPVLGLLDDAMLIELAQRALEREIDDYADFCRFRAAEARVRGVEPAAVEVERRDWLAWRRRLVERHGQPIGRRFHTDRSACDFRVR